MKANGSTNRRCEYTRLTSPIEPRTAETSEVSTDCPLPRPTLWAIEAPEILPPTLKRWNKTMDISKISPGKNPPVDINVLIEIPMGRDPVKYELDKESGALFVDRFLHTAMYYPGNYGFIPGTLSADGDPTDVLVVGQTPVQSGCIIRCRPVGTLVMEDEAGMDEKVIAVPVDDLHPYYSGVENYTDLREILRDQIAHFFTHYKDLEKGKWVKVSQWLGAEETGDLIMKAIADAK